MAQHVDSTKIWIRYAIVALALAAAAFLLGRSHVEDTWLSKAKTTMPHMHASLGEICPALLTNSQPTSADDLIAAIAEASETYSIEPELLLAVVATESRCRSEAISRRGAMGVMQLMPTTAMWLGVENPHLVRDNVLGGAKYLAYLLARYKGNSRLALGAYNAGPVAVRKHKGVPALKETQAYVKKVMALYKTLIEKANTSAVEVQRA